MSQHIQDFTFSTETRHAESMRHLDRDQLERELRIAKRELKRFRTLMLAKAFEVWFTDSQGVVCEVMSRVWGDPTPQPMLIAKTIELIHEEDRPVLQQAMELALRTGQAFSCSVRAMYDEGMYRHLKIQGVPVRSPKGEIEEWVGVSIDETKEIEYEERNKQLTKQLQAALGTAVEELSQRKQFEEQLVSQNAILEEIASNRPLPQILTHIVQYVQSMLTETKASIFLVRDEQYLQFAVGPNLPDEYNACFERVPIGPLQGSCGSAAYFRDSVITVDIDTDPRWQNYKHLALQHGLRSCWSVPILSRQPVSEPNSTPQVLGTFGLYHNEPKSPTYDQMQVVFKAAHLAAIAIDRERSKQALRESENQFRQFAENVDDVLWLADAATQRAVYFSPAFQRVFGIEPVPDMDIKTFSRFIHPEDRAKFLEDTADLFGGGSGELRYRVIHGDGRVVWVLDRWFSIHRPDGTLWRVAGTLKDVTELVASEERLANRNAELFHASRISSLGLMAAALSHEINQPLNAIANYGTTCSLLLANVRDDLLRQQLSECLDKLGAATLQTGEIVRRLRSFVRKDRMRQAEYDFHSVLNDALGLIGAEFRSRQVRVEYQLDSTPANVWGDAVQLQQVIINVLTNSAQAMAHLPAHLRVVQVVTNANQETIECRISDRGPGFGDEILKRLFEPFLTTKPQGSGIGLSICHNIIHDHGGALTAGNAPEGGAVVTIRLPVKV